LSRCRPARRDGSKRQSAERMEDPNRAFRDLESDICDVFLAADLACQLAFEEGDKIDELVFFSARQCRQLAAALKEKYYNLY
jgi:hypothetical protein